MKRPPYHGTPRDSLEVKMTPMIDVVFLLLVFFVWTASFERPENLLATTLASVGAAEETTDIEPPPPDLDYIVVNISEQDGQLAWSVANIARANLTEVGLALRGAAVDTSVPVIIAVDGAVPMGDVIDVYDLSRDAGFVKVKFAASAEES